MLVMLAAHSAVQDINTIRWLLIIGAVLMVLFWRIFIKMIILFVAIVTIILITSGAVAFLDGFHFLFR